MQADDLEELLDQARRNNSDRCITGALVYAEGIFLQILEGDRLSLQELMVKIRRDLRHETVTVLREGEVPSATFGDWKMAYVSATPQQVARWAGVSVAKEPVDGLNEVAEEQNRTAQFAQDILALLAANHTPKGNAA